MKTNVGCQFPLRIDLPNGKVHYLRTGFKVLTIKESLKYDKGYPVDQQHLFLENKELGNDEHVKIKKDTSLQLVVGSNSGDNITIHIYRIIENCKTKCKTLDVNRNDLVSDVKIQLMNSNPNQIELQSPDSFDLQYQGEFLTHYSLKF